MQLPQVLVIAALASVAGTCSAQPTNCHELWNQPSGTVCASNGRTYNNYCEVEFDRVKSNDSSLSVVHRGDCNSTSTSNSNTSNDQKPSVRSGAAENGPAALGAVAASALLAIAFAALV